MKTKIMLAILLFVTLASVANASGNEYTCDYIKIDSALYPTPITSVLVKILMPDESIMYISGSPDVNMLWDSQIGIHYVASIFAMSDNGQYSVYFGRRKPMILCGMNRVYMPLIRN